MTAIEPSNSAGPVDAGADRRAVLLFWGLAAALLPAMVLASFHFGVTWDEKSRHHYGELIWDFYTGVRGREAFPETGGHLYGGLFDLLAVAAEHAALVVEVAAVPGHQHGRAAAERHVALSCTNALHALADRHESGRARRLHAHGWPLQIEGVGDARRHEVLLADVTHPQFAVLAHGCVPHQMVCVVAVVAHTGEHRHATVAMPLMQSFDELDESGADSPPVRYGKNLRKIVWKCSNGEPSARLSDATPKRRASPR